MWEQYRRTFFGVQTVIALVAISVYIFFGHQWLHAAAFFAVMQVSAVVGAAWGARLTRMLQRRSTRLPLEGRS